MAASPDRYSARSQSELDARKMGNEDYRQHPGVMCFNHNAISLSRVIEFTDDAIDSGEVLSDFAINEFIKFSRPGLFHNLHQLPTPSSHIAEPVHLGLEYLTPAEAVLVLHSDALCPTRDSHHSTESKKRKTQVYRHRVQEEQHKRHVISHVLSKSCLATLPHR